ALRAVLQGEISLGPIRRHIYAFPFLEKHSRGRFPLDRRMAPSMAFHLLYSKSGLQLETNLQDLIRGITTADLSDISASQFRRIDELQAATIREEKLITEKMAKVQESVADFNMVDLSHTMSEMIRSGVDSALTTKEKKLEEILRVADELRLATLRAIVDVLTPIQAVHFLIAVAELHLRVHDWGKRRDDAAPSQPST
ncbi:Protein DOG1-like 3, partial [Linum perenne]